MIHKTIIIRIINMIYNVHLHTLFKCLKDKYFYLLLLIDLLYGIYFEIAGIPSPLPSRLLCELGTSGLSPPI